MKMALMMYATMSTDEWFCVLQNAAHIQHANGRLRKWDVIRGRGQEDLVFGEGRIRFGSVSWETVTVGLLHPENVQTKLSVEAARL